MRTKHTRPLVVRHTVYCSLQGDDSLIRWMSSSRSLTHDFVGYSSEQGKSVEIEVSSGPSSPV